MIAARLELIDVPGIGKILAGHDATDDAHCFVLRKVDDSYELHRVELTTVDHQVRSFLASKQSTANELTRAILETVPKPKKRASRRRKTA